MSPRKSGEPVSVIETFGAPEFYIDGTVAVFEPDVVHLICYVERRGSDGAVERHELFRCHMSRLHYERNLFAAVERMRGGAAH